MTRILAITLVLYSALALSVATWVYTASFNTELIEDRAAGEARLSESISRLKGQLDYYRALINFISQDPDVASALSEQPNEQIRERLSGIALTYGATKIDLINAAGIVIESSNVSNIGYQHSPSIVRPAFNGRLGRENVSHGDTRLIRLSRNIDRTSSLARNRAVVVTIAIAALEFEWPVSPEPIYYRDNQSNVLAANRTNLLSLNDPNGAKLTPKQPQTPWVRGRQLIWNYVAANSIEVQVLSREVPQLGLSANILLTTAGARQTALLRSLLAFASAIVLGLIGTVLFQQRRRIALESQHSATLETRVENRTKALRAAQDELVETSNLAALGRLSAGVSHELNQPLSAILNFAENGQLFLENRKPKRASDNLRLIADQARRMTRIISNLRTFARQEVTPTEKVDLAQITRDTLTIVHPDLHLASVALKSEIPDQPVFVIAGRVRLEQVILNLVSNAIDAMADTPTKQLSIRLLTTSTHAELLIIDTGNGIEAPDRVFEPFYSTKELGASKGLGMGLALSFGIIKSFGGQLSCQNVAKGAEFKIRLPLEKDADA